MWYSVEVVTALRSKPKRSLQTAALVATETGCKSRVEEIKQVLGPTESTISQLRASSLSRLHAGLVDRANCKPHVVATGGKTIQ
jgi:hypothetical protein